MSNVVYRCAVFFADNRTNLEFKKKTKINQSESNKYTLQYTLCCCLNYSALNNKDMNRYGWVTCGTRRYRTVYWEANKKTSTHLPLLGMGFL